MNINHGIKVKYANGSRISSANISREIAHYYAAYRGLEPSSDPSYYDNVRALLQNFVYSSDDAFSGRWDIENRLLAEMTGRTVKPPVIG